MQLSEAKAREFVQAVDEIVQDDIRANSNDDRSVVIEDLLKLEMNLKGEIKDTKVDMYKAMFITGIAQLLAILGGVLAIVKFMGKQ